MYSCPRNGDDDIINNEFKVCRPILYIPIISQNSKRQPELTIMNSKCFPYRKNAMSGNRCIFDDHGDEIVAISPYIGRLSSAIFLLIRSCLILDFDLQFFHYYDSRSILV